VSSTAEQELEVEEQAHELHDRQPSVQEDTSYE
jgi:hypothetical protein